MKLKVNSLLVAYYMVASMGITALSLIATVVVLSIFYHNPRQPVPGWLKILTFNGLVYITCFFPIKRQASTIQVYPQCNGKESRSEEGLKDKAAHECPKSRVPLAIKEHLSRMAEEEAENDRSENYKEEWEKAANIIDRFCLFLTLFGTTVLIIFLFICINSGD